MTKSRTRIPRNERNSRNGLALNEQGVACIITDRYPGPLAGLEDGILCAAARLLLQEYLGLSYANRDKLPRPKVFGWAIRCDTENATKACKVAMLQTEKAPRPTDGPLGCESTNPWPSRRGVLKRDQDVKGRHPLLHLRCENTNSEV